MNQTAPPDMMMIDVAVQCSPTEALQQKADRLIRCSADFSNDVPLHIRMKVEIELYPDGNMFVVSFRNMRTFRTCGASAELKRLFSLSDEQFVQWLRDGLKVAVDLEPEPVPAKGF